MLPARRLLTAARTSPWLTWWQHVQAARKKLGGIPSIVEWASDVALASARAEPWVRRRLLHAFKRSQVRPRIEHYDESALHADTDKRGWPFGSFASSAASNDTNLIWNNWSECPWVDVRVWAATRATGRFPLVLLGGEGAPSSIPRCHLCGASTIDLKHALFECTKVSKVDLRPPCALWPDLLQAVFGKRACLPQAATFVASTLRAVAGL